MGIKGMARTHLHRDGGRVEGRSREGTPSREGGVVGRSALATLGNTEAPPASHTPTARHHLHLHLPFTHRHPSPNPTNGGHPSSTPPSHSAPVLSESLSARPHHPVPTFTKDQRPVRKAAPPAAPCTPPAPPPHPDSGSTSPTCSISSHSSHGGWGRAERVQVDLQEAVGALLKRVFRDQPPQRHPLADHNRTFLPQPRREVPGVGLGVEVGGGNVIGVYGTAGRVLPPPNSPASGKARKEELVLFQLRSGYKSSRPPPCKLHPTATSPPAPGPDQGPSGTGEDPLRGLTNVPPPTVKHTYHPDHTADSAMGKKGCRKGHTRSR